ncbi:MAG TPA: succinate dehydrogenase, hydrophobic membrane anchor protein [Gammaproteobacteria bacterium]|nr:succinate dehydrogenase, hydrophobic membrane anchor protein [Gammaproteobacteria bacterium]
MSFRTPLGRARGLGSSRHGTSHWLAQRVTAIALIPLSLWFVISLLIHVRADYVTALIWLHSPVVSVLSMLLLATVFYHAYLGLQMVIEDYVHDEWLKLSALVLIKFICILLAAAGIFAVLRIAFGG